MSIIGIYVDYKLNYFYVLHLFKIKISMYWLVEIIPKGMINLNQSEIGKRDSFN